jgi:hypothetical protein
MPDAENGPLARMAEAGRAYAIVSEVTRDPDPEPTHDYERSPHSGAGNCVCGMAEHHRRHPHEFWAAASDETHCVCALPRGARCHLPPVKTADGAA